MEGFMQVHCDVSLIVTLVVQSNDFLLSIWISDTSTSRAYIAAGGYTRESAIEETENPETGRELIAFGRKYISSVRSFPSCLK